MRRNITKIFKMYKDQEKNRVKKIANFEEFLLPQFMK